MCGIFGVIGKRSFSYSGVRKQFQDLVDHAYSRGKEASGVISVSESGRINLIKSDLDGKKFLKSIEYKNFTKTLDSEPILSVIGHSRLATHGSQLEHDNNQPVVSDGKNFFLVHNGIITNTQLLWKKIGNGNDAPLLDSKVLVDYFENLLKSISVFEAMSSLYRDIEGTASIALLLPETKTYILASNTGSLYYCKDLKDENLIFASERFFLENVVLIKRDSIQHVKPLTAVFITDGKILTIDLAESETILREQKRSGDSIKFKIQDCSVPEKKSLAQKHYSVKNKIEDLKKHDFDYKRIYAIQRCAKCILPLTTPFIVFDKDGVCNFCHEHEVIQYKGEEALEQIVKKFRKGNGDPDCLAAFSGGRDSSYGLHYLKKELGLQPLAYTYDWGMVTDMARRNQARILGKLGVEHIIVSADITTKRKHIRENILAWMKNPHLGMVTLFMEGDKQCEFYADQIMRKYKLDLMFFFRGNELEKDEFKTGTCGVKDADPGGVIHNLAPSKKVKLLSFYAMQYFKNPAYFNSSFFDTCLAFFATYIQKHDYVFLWHYVPWREQVIVDTLKNEYHWETPTETKSTWRTDDGTSAFYNYIYYQVQGFTENDSFRSRQIREGLLTREMALELAHSENKPRYEALQWYFDMVGLKGSEVLTVVDNMKRFY